VNPELTQTLRCPACLRDGVLELKVYERDDREVRAGSLHCGACANEFDVRRGVSELLHDPPEHILAEAAGLERFAEAMRRDGWDRERVRRLPGLEDGYWWSQRRSMDQLLRTIPFQPGQRILDVGSNTCWAANVFASRGLCAIALDITTVELQGLYTADYFIDDGDVMFERVLGSMYAIPLASGSVDYVYCCQVLHHNDLNSLRRTFTEIFRVLRPGGRLLMVNETLKTLRDPHGVHDEEVREYEGYEHAYWALRYRWEATRAGFLTEITEPYYHPFFGDVSLHVSVSGPLFGPIARRVVTWLRPNPVVRRLHLWWLNHVWGGVSMNMIATKPIRHVGAQDRIGTVSRLLRLAAARARLTRDRHHGEAPGRVPRRPEQVAEAVKPAASQARFLARKARR
jgi:SAM-dependent methyltransferase